MWCVMAFIFVSGFLYTQSVGNEKKGFVQYFWQRCHRLLVPWILLIFLYACVWEALQLAIPNFGLQAIPKTFKDKLFCSFFPIYKTPGMYPVAEQLYFFPLLFAIQMLCHAAFLIGEKRGLIILIALFFCLGFSLYPQVGNSGTTGFSYNTFVWGVVLYGLGCLKYFLKSRSFCLYLLIALVLSALLASPITVVKFVPVILFECFQRVNVGSYKVFTYLGKASGTIFVYHTPFVLTPMILISSMLPPQFQVLSILISIFITIFGLTVFHSYLSATPWRRILF